MIGYPQEKVLKSAEFTSSSSKQEEKLAGLFDEILQQVHSRVPYDAPTDESRRTSRTVTAKTDTRKKNYTTIDQNDKLPHAKDILQTNRRSLGDVSEEKQDTDPSLLGRDVSELLTTIAQGAHGKAHRRAVSNQEVPCAELLSFLQKNIILAAASITGILSIAVLLLVLLISFIRRKKPLFRSANVTYNIFIMNGKTWCQKYQENAKKYVKKTDTEGV
ncbi:uncharacterized protein C2orf92 homolog isoform X2 [Talpa occidentalis]|uniref:uncharacterized protein C2orf92 homolog isoform X2 n=1 Tax=Talpa occidentalis TaxID=50954 RepID=UPI0018908A1A|nr:uncharacterized protein C2orf92 homolog isoform X2 [Talpa occidentalis]